ncbi:hypothetical protein [Rhodococcus sp. NPDC058521]|uniref:hypothetical protein n=1 Tax=Rhodococcus sp. NPDC058521 TaxID=3346536 RepID=UPI003652BB0C
MHLKSGQSLASSVDTTTVVVVRAPAEEVTLTCGGAEMVSGKVATGDGSTIDASHLGDSLLGKRYVDEEIGLEILCTKPGVGRLDANGKPLPIKSAKPLPSSD